MPRELSRRHVLQTLVVGGSAALAGCTGAVTSESSSDPPTTTESPTMTPAVTPPAQTPAEGECSASVPTPVDREGFPDPMDYPTPPATLTTDAVSEFVQQFERAYSHNRLLVKLADADCVQTIGVSVMSPTFDSVDTGVIGRVTVRKSYTAGGCERQGTPTGTTTPIYADYAPKPVTYYVTDRFILRDGEPVACR